MTISPEITVCFVSACGVVGAAIWRAPWPAKKSSNGNSTIDKIFVRKETCDARIQGVAQQIAGISNTLSRMEERLDVLIGRK